jgi:hypothetical protein
MDHNPGPIIAAVAPRPASMMAVSEFPEKYPQLDIVP